MLTNSSSRKAESRRRMKTGLVAIFLLLVPYFFAATATLAQTTPASNGGLPDDPNSTTQQLSPGAAQTQATDNSTYNDQTSTIQETAEQNKDEVVATVEEELSQDMGAYNDTYLGLNQWFSDDIVGNLFSNIGQLIGKWLTEFIYGWVADTVQFLTAFLRIFVLNPNIATNGLNGSQDDGISKWIRQGADVMYGIAVDLLLLLFILCIWKFWADAAWRGGGNMMGAVGRLIFTAGLLLAWPTIYAFEIQISNEMIKAIYFNSADQVVWLDAAMATAVKGGLLAGAGLVANAFAPVIGSVAGGAGAASLGGIAGNTIGGIVSTFGLIIYLILGAVLIAELVYILILKAIQTGLLTAQYMFAPIFLVFFATPDTENVTSGYVKSFVEVSLWTFVWVGLLKILVIIVGSDFNPWGKIVMAIGILQIMIQVPSFLARAQISPMSDFIGAGMITGGLLSGAKALGNFAQTRTAQLFDYSFNQQYAARGMKQSQHSNLESLPTNAANPELLTQMRTAAAGAPAGTDPNKPPTPPGMTPPPLNTGVPKGAAAETPEQKAEREKREAQQRALQAAQAAMSANGARSTGAPPASPNAGMAQNLATLGGTAGPAGKPLAGIAAGVASQTAMAAAMASTLAAGRPDPTTAMTTGEDKNDAPPPDPNSRVMNPADKFNHAGYKFVEMKGAAVAARIYDNNSIGYSNNEKNQLVGDGKGNLRHMRARKGATPEEVAHLVMAGGYTELFKNDTEGFDAARQAAIDAGEDEPKGMFERMGAGFLAANGSNFKQTGLAKHRFQRKMFEHAAQGSEAYISGKQGNAYTEYLRTRFGQWSASDDTWATYIMTDGESPESPWNPRYVPGTESLFSQGLPITEANRAASTNAHVMQQPAWRKKASIMAVAAMSQQRAKAQFGDNADPMVLAAAMGRISQEFTKDEVDAGFQIQVSNADDVSYGNVQSVARIEKLIPELQGQGYRAMKIGALAVSGALGGMRRQQQHTVVTAYAGGGGNSGGGVTAHDIPNSMLGGLSSGTTVETIVDRVDVVNNQGPAGGPGHVNVDLPGGNAKIANVGVVGGGGTGGNSGNTQTQTVRATVNAGGGGGSSGGGYNPADIEAALAKVKLNDFSSSMPQIEDFLVQLDVAGFRQDQILDSRVVDVAHQVYTQGDPGRLGVAAAAARVLGPQDFNMQSVNTFQDMVDAGWNANQISRPAMYTAQSILRQGGYPSPANIRRVWMNNEDYRPRPGGPPIPETYGDKNGGQNGPGGGQRSA